MPDNPLVLVTGAAGFIGSHLCDGLLAAGYRVRGADNLSFGSAENLAHARAQSHFEFHNVDLTDPAACERVCAGAGFVLHHAALASVPTSMADPLRCHRNTLDTTVNVLAAARQAGVRRVVIASSASVYGACPAALIGEDLPLDPLSPYAAAKAAGEQYARAFARMGLDTVILRYFNVYGPRQRPDSGYSGVISAFAARAAANTPLTVFGDGLQTRDFVHVSDVVRANLAAITRPKPLAGVALNIGTGQSVNLLELARAVGAALGRPVQVRHEPARPGDIRHSCADIARARRVLGFEPQVGLEQGLKELLAP
ncbi:MAG: SDR family NAD(P)-dependent oxidoreductase [Planctomycetes bacterium]|jgi:UDP-glucose 4-epimerase|nr:SDR family NAD(P)-dependent oxidoreductase [Planctomycetota bacterium]MCL4730076.1 SDR family NAD(P)-dependent oxidoreductase [Planctomycetota bacterium]